MDSQLGNQSNRCPVLVAMRVNVLDLLAINLAVGACSTASGAPDAVLSGGGFTSSSVPRPRVLGARNRLVVLTAPASAGVPGLYGNPRSHITNTPDRAAEEA